MSETPRGARLVLPALLGGLGLLPGVAGAADPVAALAWLTILSVGVGWWCGAEGVPLVPDACAVPGTWALFLVLAGIGGVRELPFPLHGLLVVAGLFGAGYAAGAVAARAPLAGAGVCIFLVLATSGLAVQGGFATEEAAEGAWARTHPGLARVFLEISPVVLALESSGWDLTHAHPRFYASSGVEWFPRRPWQGRLAAPAALVVGSLLAALASAVRRRRFSRRGVHDAAP